jgi:apoptotic chromatin condensation inducer in the nucleus
MTTPLTDLRNRPLEQWKVTELKDELKRRNITTKGVKDDLVKRLEEAIHNDGENANSGSSQQTGFWYE